MVAKLIIGKIIKLAMKGLVPEKLLINLVVKLGELLVKSTDNYLDVMVLAQVNKMLGR